MPVTGAVEVGDAVVGAAVVAVDDTTVAEDVADTEVVVSADAMPVREVELPAPAAAPIAPPMSPPATKIPTAAARICSRFKFWIRDWSVGGSGMRMESPKVMVGARCMCGCSGITYVPHS